MTGPNAPKPSKLLELYGLLTGLGGPNDELLQFAPELRSNLDHADRIYNGINASIDKYIEKAGIAAPPASVYMPVWEPGAVRLTLNLRGTNGQASITSIVWCIGFQPGHVRGVTAQPGLYFIGLPWLHTWGSGRFSGVARDALYLAEQIEARCEAPAPQSETAAESMLS